MVLLRNQKQIQLVFSSNSEFIILIFNLHVDRNQNIILEVLFKQGMVAHDCDYNPSSLGG